MHWLPDLPFGTNTEPSIEIRCLGVAPLLVTTSCPGATIIARLDSVTSLNPRQFAIHQSASTPTQRSQFVIWQIYA